MGILCHPNYEDEMANGVGVSIDPLYNSENTFYLNSQLGEDLITNPQANSIAEEMLLDYEGPSENDYILVQRSNLVDEDSIILNERYRAEMREFFSVIHDEFEILYEAVDNPTFAMDIEYKITYEGQLIIKQARPWTSFNDNIDEPKQGTATLKPLSLFPNPSSDFVTLTCEDCASLEIEIYDVIGRKMSSEVTGFVNEKSIRFNVNQWPTGSYLIQISSGNNEVLATHQFIKF